MDAVTATSAAIGQAAVTSNRGDHSRAVDGSEVTFEALYAAEFLPMVKLATLLVGNAEVARDVVQNTFVKVYLKWPSIEHPEAYLRKGVVNGCRSRLRWERRRWGQKSRSEETAELGTEEFTDVLAGLTARQRTAIVLRFYEQRSEAEIAAVLRCRPGTVGSLISRGLQSLRSQLDSSPTTTKEDSP